MPAAPATQPVQRGRVLRAQPGPLRQLAQQRGPGVRHHTRPVRGHHRPRTSAVTLHLGGAFLQTDLETSATSGSAARQALSLVTGLRHAGDHERPGLRRTTAPAGPYYVNCVAVEAAGKAPLY